MNHLKIGCILMAAGNAQRFGENKLAAIFQGKPLVLWAMEAIPNSLETVVVTQYNEVETLGKAYGFHVIRNSHPEWGISHTIRLGTEYLKHCDGILYMVADQPLLQKSSVEKLLTLWKDNPDRIVGAAHNGTRGNPNIFPKEFFPALLSLKGDRGGNGIIRQNPDRVLLVEIHKNELADVDTKGAFIEISKATPF